jgi:hypothetical protein
VPFPPDAELIVKQLDNQNWEEKATLRYTGTHDSFEVPVGQGKSAEDPQRIEPRDTGLKSSTSDRLRRDLGFL